MACQEVGSTSSRVEIPTIIEEHYEGVSEKVLSFSIELADILLRLARERGRLIALELVDLLASTSFDINNFDAVHQKSGRLQRCNNKKYKKAHE